MTNELMKRQEETHRTNISRRAFLQGMMSLPLMVAGSVLAPAEVEAATSITTICTSFIKIRGPRLWKSRLYVSSQGHGSGNYHIDLDYKPVRIPVLRFAGVDRGKKLTGKTRASNGRIKSYGVEWTLKRGSSTVKVDANNVPYIVWKSKKGARNYAYNLTDRQAKELLNLSTGGAIKLSTLMKWNEEKARIRGAKAVRKWIGTRVVRKSTVLYG